MLSAERLVRTLGGPRILKTRAATLAALRAVVRSGLPYGAFRAVASAFEIGTGEMTVVLDLPERTLARRRREGRLHPDESDRLLRLARIAALAEETLGSQEKARHWLHEPNRALGNEAPLRFLDSDLGAREVENILLRLSHGVVS